MEELPYEIGCRCGRVIPVSEGMAGSSLDCECGETVRVTSLGELRAGSWANREILGPARAWLQVVRGPSEKSRRRFAVMIVLTPAALWIQDGCRLRSIPFRSIEIEPGGAPEALVLSPTGAAPGETLSLTFSSGEERQLWYDEIKAARSESTDVPDTTPSSREGPVLLRGAPDLSYAELGPVEFRHQPGDSADQGVQLRAGLRGADGVVNVVREKWPELGAGAYRVTGRAVRVDGDDARSRLRRAWHTERVTALVKRMLLLVVAEGCLLFIGSVFLTGKSNLVAATGETLEQSVSSTGLAIALFFGWPLLMVVLLRILRWRELLAIAALAVLTVTSLRGLAVVAAHVAAVVSAGTALGESHMLLVLDPIDWAFIVIGIAVFRGARRHSRQASQILPQDSREGSRARRYWSRGLLATTGLFALFCVGWTAMGRYMESAYLLRPGVDPRREQAALLAYNEGVEHLEKDDRTAAERSFLKALHLWEDLNKRGDTPSTYRANLGLALLQLGLIRHSQKRADEAEAYLKRAAKLSDQLANDAEIDKETKQALKSATDVLAELRGERSDRKEEEGQHKYEEAQVLEDKDPRKAEQLYRQAIALWEEVLPEATNKEYRKGAVGRLASAYLAVAQMQSTYDNTSNLTTTLKKSIEYGEQAVELNPDRPLPKHILEVARKALARTTERAFQEEIEKLDKAAKFPEIVDAYLRSIKEQEAWLKDSKDREAPILVLANRLDRLAWFLAHCPVKGLRDTRASIEHARRAATLRPDVADHWFTLAMVQYRHGDWRESLATLETVKAKQGELDASDWLLSAMNLHRLQQKQQAREAVDKALDWMRERNRKAENDPLLQMQNQMLWPSIESLLKEARELLEGTENPGPKAA